MKTVNFLLASSNHQVNSIVEATVRDVCFEQAVVECTQTSGVDEFLRYSGHDWLNLILVAPESLRPSATRRGSRVILEEAAQAIRSLKGRRFTPVLALNVAPQNQIPLLEAGVDNVFGFPLDGNALGVELRRLLNLSVRAEPVAHGGWSSLAASFLRGWQRLKNA